MWENKQIPVCVMFWRWELEIKAALILNILIVIIFDFNCFSCWWSSYKAICCCVSFKDTGALSQLINCLSCIYPCFCWTHSVFDLSKANVCQTCPPVRLPWHLLWVKEDEVRSLDWKIQFENVSQAFSWTNRGCNLSRHHQGDGTEESDPGASSASRDQIKRPLTPRTGCPFPQSIAFFHLGLFQSLKRI